AQCEDCVAGEYCAGGEAAASACDGDSWDDDADPATPCVAKTSCAPGQYVVGTGDALNDQSCAPCAAGQFSAAADQEACAPWQNCPAGTYVAIAGTASSDQNCAACPLGAFSTTSNVTSCTP